MKRTYQKVMAALAVACMGYATPSYAADATVTTNKVWLSGATHIFGRMTVSGITSSSIKEQGFCYSSTNKVPTIDDATCKTYLTNNGNIYNMSSLTPSTVYYIRAYVKKTGGTIVYGDPVKAITRPVGGVSYGIRDGFPDDALVRIKSASKQAIDLWNEYPGIQGVYVNFGYGADTPTADCSYGGWMRVGPNTGNQKTGTLLHEMLHAIGVGTIATWYGPNSFLRETGSRGYWLGVRATRAVRFWDNSSTEKLNGDVTHMWPYGINGAHEDLGTDILYIGNSVLAEALGEDGLAPTSSQFAIPAYVFEQDDEQKYYLKNEGYSTASKFLRIDKNGNLQWIAMSAEEATANDSAAWNITFDPVTCYYSLKNVATGRYMSYKSSGALNGITTKVVSEVTAKERFHFLPSPVEVEKVDGKAVTGYWIGYVQNNSVNCLLAQTSNSIKSATLNFSADASAQRWLVLTADESKKLENAYRETAAADFSALLTKAEALLEVPHQETVEGTDATFKETLDNMNTLVESGSVDELTQAETDLLKAVRTFLEGGQATSADKPFDISFMIQNAGMDALDGWTGTPTLNYSCAEYYQSNVDFSQKLSSMPKGVYELKVQAFQRPGAIATVNTDYAAGSDKVDTYIYVGNTNNKQNICNIMADAQTKKLGVGTEVAAGTKYVPDNMQASAKYFAEGFYENTVKATTKYKATLTVGIKGTNTLTKSWVIFDNFRLFYYGLNDPATSGIREVQTDVRCKSTGVYTLGGQKINSSTDNLQLLPKGIYIVNGKKVVKD